MAPLRRAPILVSRSRDGRSSSACTLTSSWPMRNGSLKHLSARIGLMHVAHGRLSYTSNELRLLMMYRLVSSKSTASSNAVVGWCAYLRGHGWARHRKEHSVRHRLPRDQGLECVPRPRLRVARRRGCPSVCGGLARSGACTASSRKLWGQWMASSCLFKPGRRDHGASHNVFSGHMEGHGMNLQVGERVTPLCFALRAWATWNNDSN